jgi:hypothetical protein
VTDLDRYLPDRHDIGDYDRERLTWAQAGAADHVDRKTSVACPSHKFELTPVQAEPVTEDGVWYCPECGRVSDQIRFGTTGGGGRPSSDSDLSHELAAPHDLSAEDCIVISGFATVPPSDDDDDWGHWSVSSFLVEVPYSANGIVKAWPEESRGSKPETWYRRYSETFDHWVVAQEGILEFVDHMRANDYVVVELALQR